MHVMCPMTQRKVMQPTDATVDVTVFMKVQIQSKFTRLKEILKIC